MIMPRLTQGPLNDGAVAGALPSTCAWLTAVTLRGLLVEMCCETINSGCGETKTGGVVCVWLHPQNAVLAVKEGGKSELWGRLRLVCPQIGTVVTKPVACIALIET